MLDLAGRRVVVVGAGPVAARKLRALTEELGEFIPGAAGETLSLVPCVYTNSPDRQFVLDRVSDAVTVAAGFSGHGFKFASVVGEVLADLAVDGETAHPVDLFSLDRLS